MDTREQVIQELRKEVDVLKRQYESLKHASDIDPEILRAIALKLGLTGITVSTDSVTAYDRDVNEGGAATYTVAKVYDGLFLINGKIVGFYNDI